MKKLTEAQTRVVLEAVAKWEPKLQPYWGDKPGLTSEQKTDLREDVAIQLAPALGLDQETALVRMQAARMTN
jgi:hypothetical protein